MGLALSVPAGYVGRKAELLSASKAAHHPLARPLAYWLLLAAYHLRAVRLIVTLPLQRCLPEQHQVDIVAIFGSTRELMLRPSSIAPTEMSYSCRWRLSAVGRQRRGLRFEIAQERAL